MSKMTPTFRKNYSQLSNHYDEYAKIYQEIGQRLLKRLDYMKINPKRILDCGAGTAFWASDLQKIFPKAEYIALDLDPVMLATAINLPRLNIFPESLAIAGRAEQLPFVRQSFDLIISNMMLFHSQSLEIIFREMERVLAREGLCLFTTLGPDTLIELRAACQQAGLSDWVMNFQDMHELGDALLAAGFADPVMDMEKLTILYKNVGQLLRELSAIGCGQVRQNIKPSSISSIIQSSGKHRYPVTLEVIYGHAWGSANTDTVSVNEFGEARFPLEYLRRS